MPSLQLFYNIFPAILDFLFSGIYTRVKPIPEQALDSSTLLRAPTRILGSSSFGNGLDIRAHTLPPDCSVIC